VAREVLRLESVVAGYEDKAVVKGVSLSVKEGEKVVIMGPSRQRKKHAAENSCPAGQTLVG